MASAHSDRWPLFCRLPRVVPPMLRCLPSISPLRPPLPLLVRRVIHMRPGDRWMHNPFPPLPLPSGAVRSRRRGWPCAFVCVILCACLVPCMVLYCTIVCISLCSHLFCFVVRRRRPPRRLGRVSSVVFGLCAAQHEFICIVGRFCALSCTFRTTYRLID